MLIEKFFSLAQAGASVILWALLITSVISIGMIIERFFALASVSRNSNKFRDKAHEILQYNSLEEIENLAQSRSSLPEKALNYGLRHVKQQGSGGLPEVFNSYLMIEKPRLEKNLTFLATVGSNAPFVGLLGTVLGIMKAFSDLSQNVGAGNEAVMSGIADALVATAIGLFVAIPAVIAYNYFRKQVQQSLQSIDVARELCIAYTKGKKVSK